eukprot:scaffold12828_cov112-Isochrysis_galbana.AAC.2
MAARWPNTFSSSRARGSATAGGGTAGKAPRASKITLATAEAVAATTSFTDDEVLFAANGTVEGSACLRKASRIVAASCRTAAAGSAREPTASPSPASDGR